LTVKALLYICQMTEFTLWLSQWWHKKDCFEYNC